MQLIRFFQTQNYQITFSSPCAKSDNAFDLSTIEIDQIPIELNHASFDIFIKELHPDIVLFDRFMMEEQFGWRVTEHCPKALRIIDTEDLHCLRKGRHQAFKDDKTFDRSYLFNDTAKREIASIYRSDLSLIISEAEMDILKKEFKVDDALLHYLPFMLDGVSGEATEKLLNFDDRQHFITIGNFLHNPNYNAVLYLKETIWPLIKKQLPKAELRVYGAYASQKVNQLHNIKEGFLIKGFAEHVNDVMQQARVCLAPIRFGAGLKGKLVDAMQNGTPCITTTIGAEGMFGSLEPNGFIEDTPENFVNRAVDLYTNKSLWEEKQQNGFQIINGRFNKGDFQKELSNKITQMVDELSNNRLNNFTGQMLQHHNMQSTKFMSKWIEEKNK
ncbi:glycosyltransferase family 4 protein [Flavivirga jejuensis]